MALLQPPLPTTPFRDLTQNEVKAAAKFRVANICSDGTCEKDIYIGVFFDGTGNNNVKNERDKKDIEEGRQTNVVRLFNAFEEHKKDKRFYKYYIQGVGTPFKEINDSGIFGKASKLGGGMAYQGEDRIWYGLLQLINGVHHAVFGKPQWEDNADVGVLAEKLGETIGADMVLFGSFISALETKIKDKQPKITKINLSVFGFSRGAAEARVFCSYLNELTATKGGFAGIPIKVDFLGIFDTVASVGLSNLLGMNLAISSGHARWAQHKYLNIPPIVNKTTHFVAGTESRACFPSDLAVGAGQIREFVYPGSHSDVGGGYRKDALGIPTHEYAQLVGQHMYFEAVAAGVPLRIGGNLPADAKADLTITKAVGESFNAYMLAVQPKGSAVKQMRQHWRAYLCDRLEHKNYKLNPQSPIDILSNPSLMAQSRSMFCYKKATGDEKEYLGVTHDTLVEFKSLYMRLTASGRNMTSSLEAMNALVDLYNGAYPFKDKNYKGDFLDTYVHDSHAGFMETFSEKTFNGKGIMTWRGVYSGSTNDISIKPQAFRESDFHKAVAYWYENGPKVINNQKAKMTRLYEVMVNLAWTYGPGTEKGTWKAPAVVKTDSLTDSIKKEIDRIIHHKIGDDPNARYEIGNINDGAIY